MINLIPLIKGLLNLQKKLGKELLPSQGLFYKDDFEIYIKKATIEDIIEYEHNYDKENVGVVITKLKKIVRNNTVVTIGYSSDDIKSIDIVFIFLEIVKFTIGKSINVVDEKDTIEFGPKYFNYFKLNDSIMKNYDSNEKRFTIDGYKFTLPTIGIENCLTKYLISKAGESDSVKYNKYNYDFTYFFGDKKEISFSEIDNLIQIFNFDMETSELEKVKKIVKIFSKIQRYSLKNGNRVVEINSLDLEKIWK